MQVENKKDNCISVDVDAYQNSQADLRDLTCGSCVYESFHGCSANITVDFKCITDNNVYVFFLKRVKDESY